jgi:hypothetical protein
MLKKRGGVCGVARVFAWVELPDVIALPNRGWREARLRGEELRR